MAKLNLRICPHDPAGHMAYPAINQPDNRIRECPGFSNDILGVVVILDVKDTQPVVQGNLTKVAAI